MRDSFAPTFSPLLPLVSSLYDMLDSFNPTFQIYPSLAGYSSLYDTLDSFTPTFRFYTSLAVCMLHRTHLTPHFTFTPC